MKGRVQLAGRRSDDAVGVAGGVGDRVEPWHPGRHHRVRSASPGLVSASAKIGSATATVNAPQSATNAIPERVGFKLSLGQVTAAKAAVESVESERQFGQGRFAAGDGMRAGRTGPRLAPYEADFSGLAKRHHRREGTGDSRGVAGWRLAGAAPGAQPARRQAVRRQREWFGGTKRRHPLGQGGGPGRFQPAQCVRPAHAQGAALAQAVPVE